MTNPLDKIEDKSLLDWVTIPQALEIIERETGVQYHRSSFYRWAEQGKLITNGVRPLRTTRGFLHQFITDHLSCRKHQS